MPRHLCIHGHFYQPPREDPWLGDIMPEDSAAPDTDWNRRITRQSYAPLAWARRLGPDGRITDILNCYAWINFNVGPTLLHWMEREEPATYSRILEADRMSLARWGHGNAIAQAFHHSILPLATPRSRMLQIAWARADFRARFQREAEGMWLPECAADISTLEELARQGIRFTILSPHQAAAIAPCAEDSTSPDTPAFPAPDDASGQWQHVRGGQLDTTRPYWAALPSGAKIAIFFYDAPLSQAVAFERLLEDGERFWQRLSGAARDNALANISTDGETYGHHVVFGEMALAYVLGQAISGRDDLRLTNYASYLETHSPTHWVRIIDPSAWSCAHGVERWRSDCGCTNGEHPGWNQRWRGPLREALNNMQDAVDQHFATSAPSLFKHPENALIAYGAALVSPEYRDQLIRDHFLPNLSPEDQRTAWQLLEMQDHTQAAFASCAWFFDELTRIEPVNAMTFALRAMEIMRETNGPDMLGSFTRTLAAASSNKPEEGNGENVFHKLVLPRRETNASIILQALLRLWAEKRLPCPGAPGTVAWRRASVILLPTDASAGTLSGEARIRYLPGTEGPAVFWEWTPPAAGAVRESTITVRATPEGAPITHSFEQLPRNKRQSIALRAMVTASSYRLTAFEEDAANAVALFEPWTEAQHDQPLGWHWKSATPALAMACLRHRTLTPEQRGQLRRYLNGAGMAVDGSRELLTLWLEQRLLRNVEGPPELLEEAVTLVNAARELLPEIQLWAVQNALWERGMAHPSAKRLAAALGFFTES